MTPEWIGNCAKCGGRIYLYDEGICNCDCCCKDKTPCPIHDRYQYEQFKEQFEEESEKTNDGQMVKEEEIKWSEAGRILISPDWLNKDYDHYIYCQFAEDFYEAFEEDPYHTRTIYLIKILPGYGYRSEKYAVLEEWRQEGHPSYSDCYEHTLIEFDDLQRAIDHFLQRSETLRKKYPQ